MNLVKTQFSFSIERYQVTAWSVVRINIPSKEAAEAEVDSIKKDQPTAKLRIFKTTTECIFEG